MKNRIKTNVMAIFTLLIGLFFISCESRSNNETTGRSALIPQAESVAQMLLSDRSWLNKNKVELFKESPLSLSEIYTSDRFHQLRKTFPQVNCEITNGDQKYTVQLSIWNEDNAQLSDGLSKGLSSDFIYGIALDPDDFIDDEHSDEIEFTVWKSNNTTEQVKILNPDIQRNRGENYKLTLHNNQVKSSLEYPVFFVTVEEQVEAPVQDYVQNVAPSYPWLEIHEINLYNTRESGEPEFHLYRGSGIGQYGDPTRASDIRPDGYIDFNGTTQVNPPGSNRSIYIRNVDKTGEVFSEPVLVQRLVNHTDNTSDIVSFIESDEGGLKHYQKNATPWDNVWYWVQIDQYYSVTRTGADGFSYENYLCYKSSGDSDDILLGEQIGISLENVDFRLQNSGSDHFWLPVKFGANGWLFSDLNVKFKKGFWQYY